MSSISVVSTTEVAPADRLALWGDFVCRHIGPLRAETFGSDPFTGRLELGRMGSVPLARIMASRHRVLRTPEGIRRDDRSYVKLVAQVAGAGCFEQNGRRLMLAPGEWSLYDTTQPYAVSNPTPIDQVILLLPRDRLLRLGLNIDELVVRRFCGRSGVGRLTYERLVSAFDALRAGPEDAPDEDLGEAIADLVHLAVLENEGTATDISLREITRDRVKSFIAANLNDPMLSLDRIAAAMGCSKRYLHVLFNDDAETLNSYIWRSRLDRIRQDLANPGLLHQSITEIAFNRGFNSSPHFSRSFRERFGLSPRAYRLMMRGIPSRWMPLPEAALAAETPAG